MKFKYQARNKKGELQVGFVEAANKDLAARVLVDHDLFVLSLASSKKSGLKEKFFETFNRVKIKDLMIFTRQFSTLIESELPLDNALQSLYRQTKNPILREAIFQITQDVESGLSLSQALERQAPIFSDFYINMIRSAEVTGRLEEAMKFLAEYIEKEAQWRSKIISALIYPAILLSLFVVVAGIMVAVVFPKIAPVFEESGVDIPIITRVLLSSGAAMADYWWVVAFVLVGFGVLAFDYFRSAEGRAVASQVVLSVPVFGELFRKIYIARFSRSFSVLIKGGIPIAQSIEIAGDTIGNLIYGEILRDVARGVREGSMFSQLIVERDKYFPPMVGQMAAIGETTGRLEQMMIKIATFYDEEVNDMMSNLSELIQPILVAVIGILIGLLFASILLPIYNLAQSFKI